MADQRETTETNKVGTKISVARLIERFDPGSRHRSRSVAVGRNPRRGTAEHHGRKKEAEHCGRKKAESKKSNRRSRRRGRIQRPRKRSLPGDNISYNIINIRQVNIKSLYNQLEKSNNVDDLSNIRDQIILLESEIYAEKQKKLDYLGDRKDKLALKVQNMQRQLDSMEMEFLYELERLKKDISNRINAVDAIIGQKKSTEQRLRLKEQRNHNHKVVSQAD